MRPQASEKDFRYGLLLEICIIRLTLDFKDYKKEELALRVNYEKLQRSIRIAFCLID